MTPDFGCDALPPEPRTRVRVRRHMVAIDASSITLDKAVQTLRLMFRRDPALTSSLVSLRMGCGPSLSECKGVVVYRNSEDPQRPIMGTLEVINSMFGGEACIEPVLNDRGAVVDFKVAKPCREAHDPSEASSTV